MVRHIKRSKKRNGVVLSSQLTFEENFQMTLNKTNKVITKTTIYKLFIKTSSGLHLCNLYRLKRFFSPKN